MSQFERLDWDSNFFGYGVARLLSDGVALAEADESLNQLRDEGTRLVYWFASEAIDEDWVRQRGGMLVDVKTTFVTRLESPQEGAGLEVPIEPFRETCLPEEMKTLAIQAGQFSRFAVDPRIPDNKFEALYESWIGSSVNRDIADAIYVARDADKIVGLITLAEKGGRGDIGLLAVDQAYRGNRLGEKLVLAAKYWCRNQGYRECQVVTQQSNRAACSLYSKHGYHRETEEYCYHFFI